jgi:hypothetical protein
MPKLLLRLPKTKLPPTIGDDVSNRETRRKSPMNRKLRPRTMIPTVSRMRLSRVRPDGRPDFGEIEMIFRRCVDCRNPCNYCDLKMTA